MTVTPIASETRWETYVAAGVRLGITPEAVRAQAKRNRWPRQRSNSEPSGPVLVAIPPDFRPGRVGGPPPPDPGSTGGMTRGMTEVAEAFRLPLEQAEQRVVMAENARRSAEERVDRSEARADRAELAASAASERADALRERLDGAALELAEERAKGRQARSEAEAARERLARMEEEDVARKGKPRLRRLWDGLRGV